MNEPYESEELLDYMSKDQWQAIEKAARCAHYLENVDPNESKGVVDSIRDAMHAARRSAGYDGCGK